MPLTKITFIDNFVVWIFFGVQIYFFQVWFIETLFVITVYGKIFSNAWQSKYSYSEYFANPLSQHLLQLIIHLQYIFNIVLFWYLALTLRVFFSSGFLLTVTMEIGSLARLTCFWSVSLSYIFWSISNPFFQNNVFSFLLCFVSSRWNLFQ